jgi:hypothetical protein
MKIKSGIFFSCFMILSVLVSCTNIDRITITRLEPTKVEGDYTYFRYTAYADATLPIDSENAEKTRMRWLDKWLEDNGYPAAEYEILSRKPVLRHKGLLGDIYDLYYNIRIKISGSSD